MSTSITSEEEATVQLQILQELRKVTTRLDKVEEQVAVKTGKRQKRQPYGKEQSKLSKSCCDQNSKCRGSKTIVKSSSSSESESESQIPSLSVLRSSAHIQRQVDSRLRELEMLKDSATDQGGKLKSKRGGPCGCHSKT